MKKPLTSKQQEVYEFILNQYMPFGEVPSLQLIAAHFGKSKSTISQFLQQLEKRGYIKKRPYEKIKII